MTILLEPAIKACLRERAAHGGQDTNTLANALLADCLSAEDAAKEKAFEQALLASGLVILSPTTAIFKRKETRRGLSHNSA